MGKTTRLFFLCVFLVSSGCSFYFKTYKFKAPGPFSLGMSQEDVLAKWGDPLSVQVLGPLQIWKYFSGEPVYGKKKEYFLVCFQKGQIVKWEKKEEEALPPPSTP